MWSVAKMLTILLILLTIRYSGAECPQNYFNCGNDKCVQPEWVCDGDDDCGNFEDERNCGAECPQNYFNCGNDKCVKPGWVCDGEDDCGNFEDERNCENSYPEIDCERNEFKCKDSKHCISKDLFCDGEEDCIDGSDEKLCDGNFTEECSDFACGDLCIPDNWRCDGEKDCYDETDEENCTKVDRCEKLACSQLCQDTPMGAQCVCKDGYELDEKDNKTCNDIDECQYEGICTQKCLNTIGSYACACEDGYELINRTCKVKGADPLLIFATSFNEIQGLTLRSKSNFLLRKEKYRIVGVDFDPINERIYWSALSDISSVHSAKLDGTDLKTIVNHSLLVPEGIAVDYIAKNIYIADAGLKQILACNMKGTICYVLHKENVEKPRSIELDIDQGIMYWSDWGDNSSGIYSSGMDGSDKTSLASNHTGWPNCIAIDHIKNTLYWADARLNRIESIKLDGTARKVASNAAASHPYSLAIFEDILYWSDWSTSSLESCNKFSCRKKTVVPGINKQFILGMKVYHPVLKKNISNPCSSSNCSHMCLISPKNGFRCVCPHGFNLSTDTKTCRPNTVGDSERHFCTQTKRFIPHINICDGLSDCPDGSDERNCSGLKSRLIETGDENSEYIFVSDGPTVHIQKMYTESFEYFNFSIFAAVITGLSYDCKSSSLFVADEKTPSIYAVNLKSLNIRDLITNRIVAPKDIAFDFLSNNLYWVDSSKGTVEVVSVYTLKRIILLQDLANPVALAISPHSGLMFVATTGDEDCVSMYGMDGKNRKILPVQGLPMSLALHPSKPILYWTDPSAGLIAYVNYSSSRPPWPLKTGIDGVMTVAVSKEDVFWTARNGSHKIMERANLFRLSRKSNTPWQRVVYSDGKIFKGKSECLIKNGGCSYICLTAPHGRTCACSSGMKLSKKRMFCFGKKCEVNDFKCKGGQCIPGEMRCDGVIECNDGSDEMDCNDKISNDLPRYETRRIKLE